MIYTTGVPQDLRTHLPAVDGLAAAHRSGVAARNVVTTLAGVGCEQILMMLGLDPSPQRVKRPHLRRDTRKTVTS